MLCLGRGQAILYICINWFLLASAVRWVDLSYQVHSFWALKCGLCGNLVSSTYLLRKQWLRFVLRLLSSLGITPQSCLGYLEHSFGGRRIWLLFDVAQGQVKFQAYTLFLSPNSYPRHSIWTSEFGSSLLLSLGKAIGTDIDLLEIQISSTSSHNSVDTTVHCYVYIIRSLERTPWGRVGRPKVVGPSGCLG